MLVAAGDVDGDGRADVVTGMGPGHANESERSTHLGRFVQRGRVFSGADGAVLSSFNPFEAGYRGSVHLAVGHINADQRVSTAHCSLRRAASISRHNWASGGGQLSPSRVTISCCEGTT